MLARQGNDVRDSADESDALRYWLEQERAPAPDDRPAEEPEPDPLPGGWWILPALALSIPVWAGIIRLIAG